MEKVCNVCGQPAVYKEGNKNGKPWAAYFCSDKASCGNVEWVALKTNEHKPEVMRASQLPPKTNGKEINAEMMELSYKKDLMVALINSNGIDIESKFKAYWEIVRNG
jgi:hypothetical protein